MFVEVHTISNGCEECFSDWYLNEVVYVEQPKGFIDPSFPEHVYKLRKALYGLNQAPRAWYERLTEFFVMVTVKVVLTKPCLLRIVRQAHDCSNLCG